MLGFFYTAVALVVGILAFSSPQRSPGRTRHNAEPDAPSPEPGSDSVAGGSEPPQAEAAKPPPAPPASAIPDGRVSLTLRLIVDDEEVHRIPLIDGIDLDPIKRADLGLARRAANRALSGRTQSSDLGLTLYKRLFFSGEQDRFPALAEQAWGQPDTRAKDHAVAVRLEILAGNGDGPAAWLARLPWHLTRLPPLDATDEIPLLTAHDWTCRHPGAHPPRPTAGDGRPGGRCTQAPARRPAVQDPAAARPVRARLPRLGRRPAPPAERARAARRRWSGCCCPIAGCCASLGKQSFPDRVPKQSLGTRDNDNE